jgi:hypothetical protein
MLEYQKSSTAAPPAPSLLVIEENVTEYEISILHQLRHTRFLCVQIRDFAAWLQGNAQVTISGIPA